MRAEYSVSYAKATDLYGDVSGWQGLRNDGAKAGQVLLSGTSGHDGILYVGPLSGGGATYKVEYPGAASTSVYGPDNLPEGKVRLVGTYKTSEGTGVYNHGFLWDGALGDLPGGGTFRTIDYPGATYQYAHSAMGDLVVGNVDSPTETRAGVTAPIGLGVAYIYDVHRASFVANVVYPGSKSTTAYGIWHNGGTLYTICGGYSPVDGQLATQGLAFLVDYDAAKKQFFNWTSFRYPNAPSNVAFVTHFEGISSVEAGVYTLAADSVQDGLTAAQGSWVRVVRREDGTFDKGEWIDLYFPDTGKALTSANSVYGNQVVGIVIGPDGGFSYQATILGG